MRKLSIRASIHTYTSIDFFLKLTISDLDEILKEIEDASG